MDGTQNFILANDLYARLGMASAPVVLDVRSGACGADGRMIVSAVQCNAHDKGQWLDHLPPGRRIVVYCDEGGKISQAAAAALQKAGIPGAYLEGGIAGWEKRGLPTRRKLNDRTHKWVMRERPKIDRIACPWLIRRFTSLPSWR
jgi:rhodanese-related sulfurtransferase